MALLIKSINGLTYASIKSRNGLAVASIKSINGLDATSPAFDLFNQNFETPTTGYDNGETWVSDSGAPDPAYTGIVIKGSQSWHSSGTPYSISYKTFAGQTTAYGFFRVRFYSATGTGLTIHFGDNVGPLCGISLNSGGIKLTANGDSSESNSTIDQTLAYYLWLKYVSGGTCELAMSATSTKPSSDGSSQGGDVFLTQAGATGSATRISLYNSTVGALVVDNVLGSTSPIGNNPSP